MKPPQQPVLPNLLSYCTSGTAKLQSHTSETTQLRGFKRGDVLLIELIIFIPTSSIINLIIKHELIEKRTSVSVDYNYLIIARNVIFDQDNFLYVLAQSSISQYGLNTIIG